ncbi:MAG: sigma-70 family RNA polymerase sigma factor [Gemmatimonadota bacterium]
MGPDLAFEDAVTQLFRQKFASLFRYLYRLCGDSDLASDLAQEAFVRLYERGRVPHEPAGWLITVATNLYRDAERTGKRRTRINTSQQADPSNHIDSTTPDNQLIAGETRDRVRAVLAMLPLRDRQLLLLRHEGYSYRELGHILGIQETSVGTLLLRATRAFQSAFMAAGSRE